MLPEISALENSTHMMSMTSRRRKDIKSPKTNRDYKSDVLSNNLSPTHKFKPIDFRDNVIINISSTEPMRVKEYQKLCEIVTKFEQQKNKRKLKTVQPKKELGFYAEKKGYTIKTRNESKINSGLINQLKSKTSMGIVRWDPNKQRKSGVQTVQTSAKPEQCFSESPKRRKDSDGEFIVPDVGLATTSFFKNLVKGKKYTQSSSNLHGLNPDQKKKMLRDMSLKEHFMTPFEMKQIKNAFQKEDELIGMHSQIFMQNLSRIKGSVMETTSPKGHRLSMLDNNKYSKSITFELPVLDIDKEAYSKLSPRLKEIVKSNKDILK
jgi:hypothetical protein